MTQILDPNKSYTFSDFFEMKIDPIDLAEYFGYRYHKASLSMARYTGALDRLPQLEEDLLDTLSRMMRSNEQSKREGVIFPIINTAARYVHALMRIEYPLKVGNQLQGSLGYLLSTSNLQQLLVIEAKQGDIDYGFTRLMAEMIALDQWDRSPSVEEQSMLVGAVTIGELWRFGVLDRAQKTVVEDLIGYGVPSDLEALVRVLIQALKREV